MRKGLVLEIHKHFIIVITPEGEFLKVDKDPQLCDVGEEVWFLESEIILPGIRNKIKQWSFSTISYWGMAAASFLFFLSLISAYVHIEKIIPQKVLSSLWTDDENDAVHRSYSTPTAKKGEQHNDIRSSPQVAISTFENFILLTNVRSLKNSQFDNSFLNFDDSSFNDANHPNNFSKITDDMVSISNKMENEPQNIPSNFKSPKSINQNNGDRENNDNNQNKAGNGNKGTNKNIAYNRNNEDDQNNSDNGNNEENGNSSNDETSPVNEPSPNPISDDGYVGSITIDDGKVEDHSNIGNHSGDNNQNNNENDNDEDDSQENQEEENSTEPSSEGEISNSCTKDGYYIEMEKILTFEKNEKGEIVEVYKEVPVKKYCNPTNNQDESDSDSGVISDPLNNQDESDLGVISDPPVETSDDTTEDDSSNSDGSI